jgi:choline dehydrogenase-like flavoprotein
MKAIVVGSGAGGATAARELSAQGAQVLLLEAGMPFKPFRKSLNWATPLRGAGLLGDERTIGLLFPPLQTVRASDDLVLVRGLTTGGCTSISCGNLVRATAGLAEIGLDLAAEFGELEALLQRQIIPRERWRPVTTRLFRAAETLGLDPLPTPKAVDMERCVSCGLCELGCATGARWDARRFLDDLCAQGGTVQTGAAVEQVLVEGGRARGVLVARGRSLERMEADVVVLAAGGLGTPRILRASRLPAHDGLWVDIVLTLGGQLEGAQQLREPPMAWYAQRDGYILSPYVDILSHWFHAPWRGVPLERRVGLMVKLADAADGSVAADGTVRKAVSAHDRERLREAVAMAQQVLQVAGVGGPYVPGMLNGGHLGGTVPLRPEDVPGMRPTGLPEGLWVADLSLLPRSQGLPTILTTAALALRVARRILAQ